MKKSFLVTLGALLFSQVATADYGVYGAKDLYIGEDGKVISMRTHIKQIEAKKAQEARLAEKAAAEARAAEDARFALIALPNANKKTLKQLKAFNRAIRIRPVNFNIVKAANGEPAVAYNFVIENPTNRPVKEVKWFAAITINNSLVDVLSIPAVFPNGLPAKAIKQTSFLVPLKKYSESVQQALSNTQNSANIINYAGELVFTNKQKILVTTNAMMQKALQTQQTGAN